MDIEFHYYMTYLIAARAGFYPAEATVIAQSAQEIDDNHIPIEVNAGTPQAYTSTISQTMDILHPRHNKKIYPIFHFIPGDPHSPFARRKDGNISVWVTTPNSALANAMLDTALESGNLYRIGASSHAYADTWAHQNFLGIEDKYNKMPPDPSEGIVEEVMDAIKMLLVGHAAAQHCPDIPGLLWTDGRLANPVVDNTARFLDAANHMFLKFYTLKHGANRPEAGGEAANLVADLKADIGPSSKDSKQQDPARIQRYKARALTAPYGGTAIPEYCVGKWVDAAFNEKRTDIAQKLALFMDKNADLIGDDLDFGTRMPCTWRDPAGYKQTDWYKFQEAVNSHLAECWELLQEKIPSAGV